MLPRKMPVRSTFRLRRGASQLAILTFAVGGTLWTPRQATAQSIADQVGLTALIQRVGAGNQPTGAGIAVGQVEGDGDGAPGIQAYPDGTAFPGKTITQMSGALGVSGHATFVGQNLYGLNGIAPGITNIFAYEANHWAFAGYLNAYAGPQPAAPAGGLRVFNNSWIGDAGTFDNNNNINRRADYAADQHNVLMVNGVNNGFVPDPTQRPLMAYMYGGLSVGLANGQHTWGAVPAGHDAFGQSRPEIVAPHDATSYAAGIVSAAAALMYQTALTGTGLSSNLNARTSEVIKAVMLAGANHGAVGTPNAHAWTNNPVASGPNRGVTSTPLDPIYGADLVNVDRSHRILTGLEQNGSATVPTTPNATAAGWDFASLAAGGTLNYRFRTYQQVSSVSVLATWHRTVAANFASFTLANVDLTLKRIDAGGSAVTLVGDPGLPYFSSGNVVSQSAVDNIEHVFVRDLVPGDYVIELRRNNDGVAGSREVALAWIMPVTLHPGDVDGNGIVDVNDLLAVISAWGPCPIPSNCPADLNHNGMVEVNDLLQVITNWG